MYTEVCLLRTTLFNMHPVIAIRQSMKKARRKHCALAVVRWSQKFSPCRRPPSRGRGTAKI